MIPWIAASRSSDQKQLLCNSATITNFTALIFSWNRKRSFLSKLLRNKNQHKQVRKTMDSRKATFIATWLFFWLATLVLYYYNVAEFGSSSEVKWIFGTILNLFGLILWDFVIVAFSYIYRISYYSPPYDFCRGYPSWICLLLCYFLDLHRKLWEDWDMVNDCLELDQIHPPIHFLLHTTTYSGSSSY